MRSVPDCPREGCRNVHAVRCWLKRKERKGKKRESRNGQQRSVDTWGERFRKGVTKRRYGTPDDEDSTASESVFVAERAESSRNALEKPHK